MLRVVARMPVPAETKRVATVWDREAALAGMIGLPPAPLVLREVLLLMAAHRVAPPDQPLRIYPLASREPAIAGQPLSTKPLAFVTPGGRPEWAEHGLTLNQWAALACPGRQLVQTPSKSVAPCEPALPTVTVLPAPVRRALRRLGVEASSLPLDGWDRLLGFLRSAAASRVADRRRRGAELAVQTSATIRAALSQWQDRQQSAGFTPAHRVSRLIDEHLMHFAQQLDTAHWRDGAVLERQAERAAVLLLPFGHFQDRRLSADWLASQLGGPATLCDALRDHVDFATADHQLFEIA